MTLRTYSELIQLPTFEQRYDYLALQGVVGESTFGFDRWMNQRFYTSREWRRVRELVLVRDMGGDLGIEDIPVRGRPIIHHMNPMRAQDIVHGNEDILNMEYLITTSHDTHNAIHYGDASLLTKQYSPRQPGDTTLWSTPRRTA